MSLTISSEEKRAVLVLAVLFFGVLPLLPEEAIDPWGLIRLKTFVKVIAVLAAIQFASHVAVRLLGPKRGLLLTGFVAGFVSSTSLFLTLPAKLKENPSLYRYVLAAAILAVSATLVEVLVLIAMVETSLLQFFVLPILCMIATGVGFAYYFNRKFRPINAADEIFVDTERGLSKPLNLTSVLKLSILFLVLLIAVTLSNRWLGPSAATATVFFGALFEMHGVVFSTAELFARGASLQNTAVFNIAIAIVASYL